MLCVSSTVEEKEQVAVPLETVWLTQPLISEPAVLSWKVTVPPLTVLVLDTAAVKVEMLVGEAVKMVAGFGGPRVVVVFAPGPAVVILSVQEPIEPPVAAWFVTKSFQ